jgi:hypothetical protein
MNSMEITHFVVNELTDIDAARVAYGSIER